MSGDNEEAVLKILVADDQLFYRRLTSETLRALGRVRIEHAESVSQCLSALTFFLPDILVIDWDIDSGAGLKLVKAVRQGEAGEAFKRLPIVMVAAHNRECDIERARSFGVDEFVLRPFSTATLLQRISEVRTRRREFVESTTYTGPCRRRRRSGAEYDGPRRRLFDQADKAADAPDVQIRKGLARMYVERVSAMLAAADPAPDRDQLRDLCLTCGQLSALASDMRDRLLESATSSLFNYLKGVGADSPLNRDVVQAHLDAVLQLAELPNSRMDLRQTVTQQLGVMVTKKLRQAGQAA